MTDGSKCPFIVLTLRRTGGTSLVSFMSGVSDFQTVQHEPFNVDRVWGSTATRFVKSGDINELRSSISDVLVNRPNIKHCFEIIPLSVTAALIDECARLGYKFFLLTRRNEVDRIVSLEIARATDVWGPLDAKNQYPKISAGDVKVRPVDVEEAIRGYRRDATVLGQVVRILRHRNIDLSWLVFEEIYSGVMSSAEHAINIAASLGKKVLPDDNKLSSLKIGAKQDSGSIEKYVPNIDELRRRLKKLDIS